MGALKLPPWWVLLVAAVPGVANLWIVFDAWLHTPDGFVFLGFPIESMDHYQYLGLARFAGDTLDPSLPNPFVTEAQDGRFVMLYLWLVGVLARLTGLSLAVTWYAVGLVASTVFFCAAWGLITRLEARPTVRRNAFLLLCFGGGAHWLFSGVLGGLFSGSHQGDELRTLYNGASFSAAALPMWLAAYTWVLWALRRALDVVVAEKGRRRSAVLAGVYLAVAFTVHPYTGLGGLAVVTVFFASVAVGTALRGGSLAATLGRGPLWIPALALLLIGSLALWSLADPVYAQTLAGLESWRPHGNVWWYPVHYGVVFAIALVGLFHVQKKRESNPQRSLLLSLFATVVLVSLCPFIAGKKVQFMLHLPMSLLAAYGLHALAARFSAMQRRDVLTLVWILACVDSVYWLSSWTPIKKDTYYPADRVELVRRLDREPEGGVLAHELFGALTPWLAGKKSYIGHYFMSYESKQRMQNAYAFWNPEVPIEQKRAFLDRKNIRYLVAEDWILESARVPPAELPATLLYKNDHGAIYVYDP